MVRSEYAQWVRTIHGNRRLSPARFVSIEVDMDLEGVEVRGGIQGDYVASSLAEVVDTPEINNLVVATWRDRAGASFLR